MSEKLDGIRAFWNGRVMTSKHAKHIWCPKWFIEHLPNNVSLDGELWLGRGTLELLGGVLNSKEDTPPWKNIILTIFDMPSSSAPYEIRIRDLTNLVLPHHVRISEVERCRGKNHLQDCLLMILDVGGEGLMLNKPNSVYVASRTDTLLKLKVC